MKSSQKTAAAFLLCLLCACNTKQETTTPDDNDNPSASDRVMDQVKDLYEKAKGTSDPSNAVDWAKDDIKKIGDWEYKIVVIADLETASLEQQLNELGEDRWEVFWVQPSRTETRFFLKRTARSYLRHIPLSELGKILTPEGGE